MNTQTATSKPAAPAHPNATRANAAKAEAKPAAAKKEAKVDETLTKKVKVLADKNPKKEGSKAAARFALYKTGQTVEAYLTACVAVGESRRNARNDITYDLSHKFIELS